MTLLYMALLDAKLYAQVCASWWLGWSLVSTLRTGVLATNLLFHLPALIRKRDTYKHRTMRKEYKKIFYCFEVCLLKMVRVSGTDSESREV